MPDAHNLASPCPHCDFLSEDSELCQACGKIMDTSFPEQSFSISETFATSSLAGHSDTQKSWMGQTCNEEDKMRLHPSYAYNPSNIFYNNEE